MAQKILIVEDEEALAASLELKLEHTGYHVVRAHNGREALDILDKEKIDIVLLDLVMPEMNGFETLEELKRRGNRVPVIVTTNLSQGEDLQKAKGLGAVDYIVKADTPLKVIVARIQEELADR